MKTAAVLLALLFSGMVVVHPLSTTGLFKRIGAVFLRATQECGKRFLLLLIALVAPCAFFAECHHSQSARQHPRLSPP
jgi:Na+/H+ antiporter NhaD/arsenite permease-like protein